MNEWKYFKVMNLHHGYTMLASTLFSTAVCYITKLTNQIN